MQSREKKDSAGETNKDIMDFGSKRSRFFKRAMFYDKLTRGIIFAGGFVTIVAVIGILLFVFLEAFPLWKPAEGIEKSRIAGAKHPLVVGVDEYRSLLFAVTDSATVDFISLESNKLVQSISLDSISGGNVISATKSLNGNFIACGTDDGRCAVFEIEFNTSFDENSNRIITTNIVNQKVYQLDSAKGKITKMVYRNNSSGKEALAVVINGNKLIALVIETSTSLIDEDSQELYHTDISHFVPGKISAMELDDFCDKLMIGTEDGSLYYISFKEPASPELIQSINNPLGNGAGITALGYILGDQTIVVGDSKGSVYSLMRVLDDETEYGWKIVLSHHFEKQDNAITQIAGSSRNKSFITGDANGNIFVRHLTSERTLLKLSGANSKTADLMFSQKNDGAIALFENGTIINYDIDNPHPEITFKTVFGKVWYEGYKQPEFVWQSTGGSDDFEPKFSLIPLIIGTLKGTFYALFFAIPIALLGAIYTSLFAHPKIKNIIKPVVEIMAALPSVVIGFLAGLWLAPILEKELPSVFLMFFTMPVILMLGALLWLQVPKWTGKHIGSGWEVLIAIPLLLIGGFIALQLGPIFEQNLLGGDFREWLKDIFAQQYDQRNAIVVGFAMGFAVIPIIFTISEDSLASVPDHLKSSSLALGATRWQTAVRIVIPTASPGIFSAIMVGFGRAIGETMIVLMATGNTPILDFSLFNGMRTLSANIAVEIPEAPMGGTLYRVLFLSAALLFIMTFIVNTVAEIVRQRLRKKYMHI